MAKQINFTEVDLEQIFRQEGGEEGGSFFQAFIANYANKAFKYYVLETNFNLSSKTLRRIADVSGVERIIPMSRYRALINFGNLFDIDLVQKEIRLQTSKLFYSKGLSKKNIQDSE